MRNRGIYRIAERIISIDTQYSYTHKICEGYRISASFTDFSVYTEDSDIDKEDTQTRGSSRPYLESLAVYRKICEKMPDYDTFLIHGSALAMDGQAYLFTAPSGTGKSTHAALWRECFGSRVTMINDDKPLIKVENEDIRVCGTPWSGKDDLNTNITCPLHAVCVLERGETPHISRVDPADAYVALYRQTYRPQSEHRMIKTFDMLAQIVNVCPVYKLKCNISLESAREAYFGMAPL